jgi:hypothetical protein
MRRARAPKSLCLAVLLALASAIAAPSALAQTGGGTEIIVGRVLGPDGQPVAGARVEATSMETQTTRGRTTNDKGQFTILFPDGSGQYRVVVRAIGFASATQVVTRQSDEDRLDVSFRLTRAPQSLAAVNVLGNRGPLQSNADRPTPGTQERVLTGDQLYRLPIDATDPTALAGMAAGVVTLAGTDSSASAFSVAGQRPDQNQVTLDGLSFGNGSVPQEAVRNSRVVTSTYDVARGQFTGGQVASTTRSGTNELQGSLGYDLRAPELQFPDEEAIQFGQRYTQNQYSFGLGGPIRKNKLFIFGSAQWRTRTDGLQSLSSANDEIFARYGVSPDSASRFLDIVDGFGIPARVDGVPSRRLSENLTTLTRLDWVLTDKHTVSLRGDWRFGVSDGQRISALTLPHYGGDLNSLGGGVLASVISQFDNGLINEARVYGAIDTRDTKAYFGIPEGRVRVTSDLADGTTGISSLVFGGNGALPQDIENDQLEATNELSFITADGAHRLKLGALVNMSRYNQDYATNRNGSFLYNSLAELENGTPVQFTRTLAPTERNGGMWNSALYLGDTWRKSRALQFTYGARFEATQLDGHPRYNPDVDARFGRRTDRFPKETHLSPRVGFTWTLGLPPQPEGGAGAAGGQGGGRGDGGGARGAGGLAGAFPGGGAGVRGGGGGAGGGGAGGGGAQVAGPFAGLATTIIRGGIGEFRGRAPSGLFTSALDATGLAGAETQLVCVGSTVPTPDWTAYQADASSVPSVCADGSGGSTPFGSQRPNVTTFDEDFGAPRSWRASLGVQRRFLQRLNVSVDVAYALGINLYGVRDLNLDATPQFTLVAEGGRPVFVGTDAIVPTTGVVNNLDSRVEGGYGSVYAIGSRLRSDNRQATLSVNGFLRNGILMSASYTYARSRDQSSFSCCNASQAFGSPTTDGDPNATPWGTSDLERRHVIITTATWPATPSLELTVVGRLTSGQPYTPRVNGDINGDGARNDRAFIFDPATTGDPVIADGMSTLLANASGRVRDCLEGQMGGIAGRNSCHAPWFPSVDVRLNYRPDHWGLKRNLMLSLQLQNPLAGLDRLFNGDDVEGWGQPRRIDPNLLYVTGFDAGAQEFRYAVNERFGDGASTGAGGRGIAQQTNPFQVALQLRYTIGPDRTRQAMLAAQAAARGGAGGGGAGGMAGMVRRLAPNTFNQLLNFRDSLALDSAQVARLTELKAALDLRIDTLAADVQRRFERLGNNADPQATMAQMRGPLEEAQRLQAQALKDAQTVLTPAQWEKVPPRIKNPRPGMPGLGGQAPPGGAAGRRVP